MPHPGGLHGALAEVECDCQWRCHSDTEVEWVLQWNMLLFPS